VVPPTQTKAVPKNTVTKTALVPESPKSLKKPRKVRSDKGKPRGPRKSKKITKDCRGPCLQHCYKN